jgi:hypothetical protein
VHSGVYDMSYVSGVVVTVGQICDSWASLRQVGQVEYVPVVTIGQVVTIETQGHCLRQGPCGNGS